MAVKSNERFVKWHYERWCFSLRVQRMTALERGVYHSALMIQVQYGTVPSDPEIAAQIMHLKEADVKKAWPVVLQHFEAFLNPQGETVLINRVMAKAFDFARDYAVDDLCALDAQMTNAQCAKSAQGSDAQCANSPSRTRAGALVLSDSSSDSNLVLDDDCAPDAQIELQPEAGSPAAPPVDKRKQAQLAKAQAASRFQEFWQTYPVKKDKQRAMEVWMRIGPDEQLMRTIMNSLAQQMRTEQWRRGVIPHASTWLRNSRWEDETDAQNRNAHAQTEEHATEAGAQNAESLPTFDPIDPSLWSEAMYHFQLADPDAAEVWLKPLQVLGRAGDEIWIGAMSDINRNWVASNYREQLAEQLKSPVRIITIRNPEAMP